MNYVRPNLHKDLIMAAIMTATIIYSITAIQICRISNAEEKVINTLDQTGQQIIEVNNHLNDIKIKLESLEKKETEIHIPEEVQEINIKLEEIFTSLPLPNSRTNTYRYMDYRTITDKSSYQYDLQRVCYTDTKTGIRCIEISDKTYLLCAMSTKYANIGDTFRVTLNNGHQFYVICGDAKNPNDSNSEMYGHADINYDGEATINVIEFINDADFTPQIVKDTGTYTALDHFGGLFGNKGDIILLEYIDHYDWIGDRNNLIVY